jgi:hypothetical protein
LELWIAGLGARFVYGLAGPLHYPEMTVLLHLGDLSLESVQEITDLLSVVQIKFVAGKGGRAIFEARGASCTQFQVVIEILLILRVVLCWRLGYSLTRDVASYSVVLKTI